MPPRETDSKKGKRMTVKPDVVFDVVKGNPTEAEVAAIGEALRTMALAASTGTMPQVANALNNWGDVNRQFAPVLAYAPTAYVNL